MNPPDPEVGAPEDPIHGRCEDGDEFDRKKPWAQLLLIYFFVEYCETTAFEQKSAPIARHGMVA
jgi:hypothetical protein